MGKIILCNGWGICCSSTSAMSSFSGLPTTSLVWNKVSVSALPLTAGTRTAALALLKLHGTKLSLALQYGKKWVKICNNARARKQLIQENTFRTKQSFFKRGRSMQSNLSLESDVQPAKNINYTEKTYIRKEHDKKITHFHKMMQL